MTENEAIEVLTDRHTSIGTTKCNDVAWRKLKPAIDTAVNALEEIQQYRAIGTVEEIKKLVRFLSLDNDNQIIEDMELLNKYKFIGTVEDCREARERQKGKKPILNENVNIMFCPICERKVKRKFDLYCSGCGQKLDWSE